MFGVNLKQNRKYLKNQQIVIFNEKTEGCDIYE